MSYTITCSDSGTNCPYVAKGATHDEVLKDVSKHMKAVHGYTDEQVKDPKFLEGVKKLIKTKN